MYQLTWPEIKSFIDARSLNVQFIELTDTYLIAVFDGPFQLNTQINKTDPKNTDQEDFEDNYKTNGNKTIIPTDTDGSPLSRVKTTKSGWHYQPHGVEISTSKYGNAGFYNKDVNGNDLGFVTCKIYDIDGNEIVSSENETQAVMTEIEWMPNHDYEIIAGQVFQGVKPGGNCRMWVTGLPGVADVKFAQGGLNLIHVGSGGRMDTDGRTPKMLFYNNPIPGTNKFRITLKYDQGLSHSIQFIFEIFKA